MKNLLLLFLSFFVMNLFSQNNNSSNSNGDYNINFSGNPVKAGMWVSSKIEDKSIIGSPFLFNSWEGFFSVVTKSGNRFDLINLNYNIQTKRLESKISNDSVFQYDLNVLDFVLVAKKKYKIFNNELFLQLMDNNAFVFLKSYDITIQEATNNPLTQSDLTPRRYVIKNEYKILQENTIKEFKLNKKSFFNFFPEKKELISKYVNENRLSYSKEEDAITILYYISNNN